MSKTFTGAEVASHNTASDLWIILNEEVYDVTEFQKTHPGGEKSMLYPLTMSIFSKKGFH